MPVEHVAVLIPIIAVGGFFAWMIALSPVGKAFAERLRQAPPRRADSEDLRTALEDLRREVAELAERVDFTERLLSKPRAAERLEPPR